ncbi:hypothetical protein HDV05_006670 [Chytridiales sp. JEL 0842]|nr:hypothetical protein HDV05_006670 [Chytridiales sp. JEL 0842]
MAAYMVNSIFSSVNALLESNKNEASLEDNIQTLQEASYTIELLEDATPVTTPFGSSTPALRNSASSLFGASAHSPANAPSSPSQRAPGSPVRGGVLTAGVGLAKTFAHGVSLGIGMGKSAIGLGFGSSGSDAGTTPVSESGSPALSNSASANNLRAVAGYLDAKKKEGSEATLLPTEKAENMVLTEYPLLGTKLAEISAEKQNHIDCWIKDKARVVHAIAKLDITPVLITLEKREGGDAMVRSRLGFSPIYSKHRNLDSCGSSDLLQVFKVVLEKFLRDNWVRLSAMPDQNSEENIMRILKEFEKNVKITNKASWADDDIFYNACENLPESFIPPFAQVDVFVDNFTQETRLGCFGVPLESYAAFGQAGPAIKEIRKHLHMKELEKDGVETHVTARPEQLPDHGGWQSPICDIARKVCDTLTVINILQFYRENLLAARDPQQNTLVSKDLVEKAIPDVAAIQTQLNSLANMVPEKFKSPNNVGQFSDEEIIKFLKDFKAYVSNVEADILSYIKKLDESRLKAFLNDKSGDTEKRDQVINILYDLECRAGGRFNRASGNYMLSDLQAIPHSHFSSIKPAFHDLLKSVPETHPISNSLVEASDFLSAALSRLNSTIDEMDSKGLLMKVGCYLDPTSKLGLGGSIYLNDYSVTMFEKSAEGDYMPRRPRKSLMLITDTLMILNPPDTEPAKFGILGAGKPVNGKYSVDRYIKLEDLVIEDLGGSDFVIGDRNGQLVLAKKHFNPTDKRTPVKHTFRFTANSKEEKAIIMQQINHALLCYMMKLSGMTLGATIQNSVRFYYKNVMGVPICFRVFEYKGSTVDTSSAMAVVLSKNTDKVKRIVDTLGSKYTYLGIAHQQQGQRTQIWAFRRQSPTALETGKKTPGFKKIDGDAQLSLCIQSAALKYYLTTFSKFSEQYNLRLDSLLLDIYHTAPTALKYKKGFAESIMSKATRKTKHRKLDTQASAATGRHERMDSLASISTAGGYHARGDTQNSLAAGQNGDLESNRPSFEETVNSSVRSSNDNLPPMPNQPPSRLKAFAPSIRSVHLRDIRGADKQAKPAQWFGRQKASEKTPLECLIKWIKQLESSGEHKLYAPKKEGLVRRLTIRGGSSTTTADCAFKIRDLIKSHSKTLLFDDDLQKVFLENVRPHPDNLQTDRRQLLEFFCHYKLLENEFFMKLFTHFNEVVSSKHSGKSTALDVSTFFAPAIFPIDKDCGYTRGISFLQVLVTDFSQLLAVLPAYMAEREVQIRAMEDEVAMLLEKAESSIPPQVQLDPIEEKHSIAETDRKPLVSPVLNVSESISVAIDGLVELSMSRSGSFEAKKETNDRSLYQTPLSGSNDNLEEAVQDPAAPKQTDMPLPNSPPEQADLPAEPLLESILKTMVSDALESHPGTLAGLFSTLNLPGIQLSANSEEDSFIESNDSHQPSYGEGSFKIDVVNTAPSPADSKSEFSIVPAEGQAADAQLVSESSSDSMEDLGPIDQIHDEKGIHRSNSAATEVQPPSLCDRIVEKKLDQIIENLDEISKDLNETLVNQASRDKDGKLTGEAAIDVPPLSHIGSIQTICETTLDESSKLEKNLEKGNVSASSCETTDAKGTDVSKVSSELQETIELSV